MAKDDEKWLVCDASDCSIFEGSKGDVLLAAPVLADKLGKYVTIWKDDGETHEFIENVYPSDHVAAMIVQWSDGHDAHVQFFYVPANDLESMCEIIAIDCDRSVLATSAPSRPMLQTIPMAPLRVRSGKIGTRADLLELVNSCTFQAEYRSGRSEYVNQPDRRLSPKAIWLARRIAQEAFEGSKTGYGLECAMRFVDRMASWPAKIDG